MPTTREILVVEDDSTLAELVSLHLRDLGCRVRCETDGQAALAHALARPPDLLILDRMLPVLPGLDVCRALREAGYRAPILMLTAKSTELDRVTGLEAGADDYLTKPFGILELLARVKALFRRAERFDGARETEHERALEVGDLRIDPATRSVSRGAEEMELTAREFDLLVHLARHPGRVFSRAELLDRVWGRGHDGYEHTVNSHINRLRAKLERDPRNPDYVLTVWGVGYKLRAHPGRDRAAPHPLQCAARTTGRVVLHGTGVASS